VIFSVEAIVCDDPVRLPGTGKLDSGGAPVLRLRCNPKLLDTLRTRSRHDAVRVVAFKLTHGADTAEAREAVEALFARGPVAPAPSTAPITRRWRIPWKNRSPGHRRLRHQSRTRRVD